MAITLYIPPNKPDVRAFLIAERTQASNIKSKQTRKAIEAGLTSILAQFESKMTPKGVVLVYEESLRAIEPPTTISSFIYHCGREPHLEPLQAMSKPKHTVGLVVVDLKECTIASWNGTTTIHDSLESQVPKNHHHGGQSSRRFERLRDEAIHEWFKKCAERVNAILSECDYLLVGGPGRTKEELVGFLDYRLKPKVTHYDVGYTNEYGIRELSNEARPFLETKGIELSDKLVRLFLERLAKGLPVAYGQEVETLPSGCIDRLLDQTTVNASTEDGKMFLETFKAGAILRYDPRKGAESKG